MMAVVMHRQTETGSHLHRKYKFILCLLNIIQIYAPVFYVSRDVKVGYIAKITKI